MPMRKENFRMKWESAGVVAAILAAAFATALLAHADQKKGPAGSVLVPDKGKLNILIDGKSIGHEEFEITPEGNNWIAKGTTKVSMEGAPAATVTGSLTLQPDGSPISYEWTAQTDKTNGAHIAFENGVAKMTLQMQGARPFEQDLSFDSPHIAVLDNNLYHQYAVLARLYDWSKRGTQTFSVLIPQELTPGTITVDWVGAVNAGGKTYEGLKLITTDIEMVLYLDTNHKLMRLEVPASKAAVVRE
jgi:phage baseplate assembly protein gpV